MHVPVMLREVLSKIAKVQPANLVREVVKATPGLLRGHSALLIDYPPHEAPRYGAGKGPHRELFALLNTRRDAYRSALESFLSLKDSFTTIPVHASQSGDEPAWFNGWLPALDAVALYGFATRQNPALYLEIGSGNSTRFLRRAIRDQQLRTRIVSIDPCPRAEIDPLCDEVIRSPLEQVDLAIFERLQPGDILFFDGSHRVLMNSDVTVFFLEVLPRLKPGVLVHIHDITLPWDYPEDWAARHYSEQYVLATLLLFGGERFEITFPSRFIAEDPELSAILAPLWNDPRMKGAERHGCSFWFTKKAG